MGAGTSHHTFWPEFPLEVRLPSPQCGEGKRISQRPAFSAPPHLRGGNGTNQPRTLPAPSASLCRTHRVRSAGSGEEASPARLPPTATPRSVWRTLPAGLRLAQPVRTFFPSPGKVSRVQRPQVLDGHLEDLRLLQLPGGLQGRRGLSARRRRPASGPVRGAICRGLASGCCAPRTVPGLGAQAGKEAPVRALSVPRPRHLGRGWQQRVPVI